MVNAIKPKLLLHTCCAPCGAFVFKCLKNYHLTCYWYNPNIWPREEYERRKQECKKYCEKNKINFIEEEYEAQTWNDMVQGLEKEPEKGKRCDICFQMRLEKTACFAKENDFDIFATTLTISPHKNSKKINEIGNKIAKKLKIKFYEADWKKNDGFKKSCEISKQEGFYRQNYCGCQYSIRKYNIE